MFSEADIKKVVDYALAHGRVLERDDAAYFLRAKELLASDPEHEAAKSVVASTKHFITTGVTTSDFWKFTLGCCDSIEETDAKEQIAKRYREAIAK